MRLGIPAFPAVTNNIDPRINAVERMLLQQRDGGPALLIDKGRCPKLAAGMAGLYRYSKTTLDVSKPLPDKNPWSHVADALQYAAMGTMGQTARQIARVLRPRPRSSRPRMSAAGWT